MAISCFNFGFLDPFEDSHRVYQDRTPEHVEAPVDGQEAAIQSIETALSSKKIDEAMSANLKGLVVESAKDGFDAADQKAVEILLRGNVERFALKQDVEASAVEGTFTPTFLRRTEAANRTRVLPTEKGSEFREGQSYRVDFTNDLPKILSDRAKANVGLHEVMPPEVTVVEVRGIQALRRGDGKFFDNNGNRVWIKDQEEIKVMKRASKSVLRALKPEETTLVDTRGGAAPLTAQEQQKREALERSFDAEASYTQEKTDALNAALGKVEGSLGTLEKKSAVAIPEELHGLKGEDYSRQLFSMDYGKQVWTAAEELGRISGKSGTDVLKKVMDYKQVRYAELTHAVFGPLAGPEGVRKRYEKALEENEIVQAAGTVVEEEVAKLLDPAATSDFLFKDELLADLAVGKTTNLVPFRSYLHTKIRAKLKSEGSLTNKNAGILKDYINGLLPPNLRDPVLKGTDRIEILEKNIRDLESFLSASYRLMEAIPELEENEMTNMEVSAEGLVTKSGDVVIIEQVAADIFTPDDKGPTTMQTLTATHFAKGEDPMEYYISNAAAYQQLRDGMTSFERGQEVADLDAFCTRLYELRQRGWEKGQSLGDAVGRGIFKSKRWLKKYPTAPTSAIEVSGEGSDRTILLSEEDKELIQLGMAWEQTEQYVLQKQEAEAFVESRIEEIINAYPEPLRPLLSSVSDITDITAAELQDFGDHMIEELDLGNAGVLLNQDRTVDRSKEEPGNPGEPERTVHNEWGFGYGRAMVNWESPRGLKVALLLEGHGNVFEHRLGISGGVHVEKALSERTRLGATAFGGIGISKENPSSLIPAGGVTVNFSVDLDKYRVWSLGLEAGAGFAGPLLYLNQGVSINRDLGQVAVKRSIEAREAFKADMEAGYDSFMKAHQDVLETMSPKQAAEFKDAFLQHYERDMQNAGIEAMKTFQFVGAGIKMVEVFLPGGGGLLIPVIWVRAGVKGRERIHYSQPRDLNLDAVAQARLAKDMAEHAGLSTSETVTLYTSGRLELTDKGQKTLTESRSDEITADERLDSMNASLDRIGVSLERVDNSLRVKVGRVDGVVNLYTDPASGVETYIEEGNVYVNLDRSQPFFINRVDSYSPFENFGHTHEVNLYISKNKYITPRAIELSSKDQIRWKQSDRKGTRSSASVVMQSTADRDSATFENAEDLESSVELENYFDESDLEARREARRLMQEALGVINSPRERVDVADMTRIALLVVEDESVSYAKITTDELYYGKKIQAAQKFAGRTLNREEIAVVTQEILVLSRAKGSEDPEVQAAHILKWNQIALMNNLIGEGVPEDKALSISEKITQYYAEAVRNPGSYKLEDIHGAGVVATLIGPKATGQFGEMVSDTPNLPLSLYGAESINDATLRKIFGNDTQGKEETRLFKAAQASLLAELDTEKPNEFMRTELGLAVLEAADLIWGPETATTLANFVKKNPRSTAAISSPAEGQAWAQYASLVQKLRESGSVEINGVLLSTTREQKMGFLESCQNFTTTWSEGLTVTMELERMGAGAMARVQRYVEGRKGIRLIKGGVAFAYNQTTDDIPPPKRGHGRKKDDATGGSNLPEGGGDKPGVDPYEEDAPTEEGDDGSLWEE